MMWTRFWDMHSGGDQKLQWHLIFIEAPIEEAKSVFYAKFGRNPDRVTCTCCGEDYAVAEGHSLEQITAYHRGCTFNRDLNQYVEQQDNHRSFDPYQTLSEFEASGECRIVRADEIAATETHVNVPKEGYVWVGGR